MWTVGTRLSPNPPTIRALDPIVRTRQTVTSCIAFGLQTANWSLGTRGEVARGPRSATTSGIRVFFSKSGLENRITM